MKGLLRTLIMSAGSKAHSVKRPAPENVQSIHFLHIGKNAGTQISNISKRINELPKDRDIVIHPHDVFLKDIPPEASYFFSIRKPISRFKSDFYSRKRKGQPRYFSEWTPHDVIAFSDFEHANDLAESLFEPGKTGRKAWAAMKSIRHTSQNQCDWFSCYGNFLRVRPPIWIVRQENFDMDLKKLFSIAFPCIDLSEVNFRTDELSSHRSDYSGVPPLSQKAKKNLAEWYAQDIMFYDMCNDWLEEGGIL